MGYFLSFFFRNVNAVISKDLAVEFSLSPSDLGFLTSMYLLAFAAFQLPLGVLLDRYGPRRVVAALGLITRQVRSATAAVRMPSTDPGPSQKINASTSAIRRQAWLSSASTQAKIPVPASVSLCCQTGAAASGVQSPA